MYVCVCVCVYVENMYEKFSGPCIGLSPKPLLLLLLPFARYERREIRLFQNTFTGLAWEK